MQFHFVFLALGALLLAGMVADEVGRRTRLPRVSLLILIGIAAGPSVLDLVPTQLHDWYEFLASAALTMIAFVLGGRLSAPALRHQGRAILTISGAVVIVTAVLVGAGLFVMGTPVILALLLAGIATATDPAATQDVVQQVRAKGPFTGTLLGIVAVDDAWGLILFSLLMLVAKAIAGDGGAAILLHGAREFGGALLVGAVVGIPAAYLTGRLQPGEPVQAEALGVVFVCAGLAVWLEVSYLLAGITAGAIVANLARHHTRPFHEIENVEWPFLVLFFVLAGAAFDLATLPELGIVGGAYVVLRVAARVAGGWLGGRWGRAPAQHCRWIGAAMVPQAGVALGMALVAASQFPALGKTLLAVAVGSTVLFELFGPILTKVALHRVGEAGKRDGGPGREPGADPGG